MAVVNNSPVSGAKQAQNAYSLCPACGYVNLADAVFCAHPECHKALGEFKYVSEELAAKASWHETLAEYATSFIGRPHFLVAHGIWFLLWIAVNSGLIAIVRAFDAYPFSLLGILLAIEAILISGFVLISQNRQNAHADKRAELDYEVSVRTYRQITHVDNKLNELLERLERLEARNPADSPQG